MAQPPGLGVQGDALGNRWGVLHATCNSMSTGCVVLGEKKRQKAELGARGLGVLAIQEGERRPQMFGKRAKKAASGAASFRSRVECEADYCAVRMKSAIVTRELSGTSR